jgi:copper chaperone CopZ
MNTIQNRRRFLKSAAIISVSTAIGNLWRDALVRAADVAKDDEGYRPHTPTLVYYLSNITGQPDADAILAVVQKLPSVRKVNVNLARGYAQVRFDSHVVSYHQVAQAIADAGTKVGKKFEPRLKIRVPEYSQGENATKVDAVFAGKRLNQRVRIEPLDKRKGDFFVHLLPLKVDPAETGPQGFNGGHLNHPLHDPPPRGLGLTCIYAAEDDGNPADSK